jgi:hypothetical protein
VPMLAELLVAVVGVDTHRDTHQVEIALPNGAPIAVTTISNDTTGYAELLAWIVDHAPGPRLAVSIEGTRSYGIGLARAAAAWSATIGLRSSGDGAPSRCSGGVCGAASPRPEPRCRRSGRRRLRWTHRAGSGRTSPAASGSTGAAGLPAAGSC